MKILMVEDERALAEAVSAVLQKNNFSVDIAYDGEYGLDCALTGIYDMVILDLMLPKLDGLRVLSEMRDAGIKTPVLILSARGEIPERVRGLDCGADDYLPKPFHTEELLARLRALSRRKDKPLSGGVLTLGGLSFCPGTLSLISAGQKIALTLKESQLLELLIEHRGVFISKDMIIEKLWRYDADVFDSNVESQISLLRKKLTLAGGEFGIKAARGVGYRLEETGRGANV